jgi:hypothetical protein
MPRSISANDVASRGIPHGSHARESGQKAWKKPLQ